MNAQNTPTGPRKKYKAMLDSIQMYNSRTQQPRHSGSHQVTLNQPLMGGGQHREAGFGGGGIGAASRQVGNDMGAFRAAQGMPSFESQHTSQIPTGPRGVDVQVAPWISGEGQRNSANIVAYNTAPICQGGRRLSNTAVASHPGIQGSSRNTVQGGAKQVNSFSFLNDSKTKLKANLKESPNDKDKNTKTKVARNRDQRSRVRKPSSSVPGSQPGIERMLGSNENANKILEEAAEMTKVLNAKGVQVDLDIPQVSVESLEPNTRRLLGSEKNAARILKETSEMERILKIREMFQLLSDAPAAGFIGGAAAQPVQSAAMGQVGTVLELKQPQTPSLFQSQIQRLQPQLQPQPQFFNPPPEQPQSNTSAFAKSTAGNPGNQRGPPKRKTKRKTQRSSKNIRDAQKKTKQHIKAAEQN